MRGGRASRGGWRRRPSDVRTVASVLSLPSLGGDLSGLGDLSAVTAETVAEPVAEPEPKLSKEEARAAAKVAKVEEATAAKAAADAEAERIADLTEEEKQAAADEAATRGGQQVMHGQLTEAAESFAEAVRRGANCSAHC